MLLAQSVGSVDIAMIIVYLGIIAYLGWLGYRRTKSTADYLLAGRQVHPFVMSMSYGATFISTSAIVGFGGVAAMFGMSLLWLTFANIFVGIFIAFVVLGGPTRRMGHRLDAHTFPELLGRRFNSKGIQVFAGLIIFAFMPVYAAAVLIGGTEFVSTQFGMPYTMALLFFACLTAVYVFFGGLKGVLYTDAFQGSIMTVGMLVLLVSAYMSLGGVKAAHEELSGMVKQVPAGFQAIGHQGWTMMPKFGWGDNKYNLWWIVVSTIVMGVGIGVLAQPQLALRFLTVKSGRELNRALAIGGMFILLMTGVAFTVGALSNVYFAKKEVIEGTIAETINTKVVAKREPGKTPVTIPCNLLRIVRDKEGHESYAIKEILAKDGPKPVAKIEDLGNGRVRVRPNVNSFMRAVVITGKDADGKDVFELNPDSIIPIYVKNALPRWFGMLFMLTLLSAAMSTMSSQYHSLGTAIGRDVYEQLARNPKSAPSRTIHVVRAGIIVGLVLAIVLGYYTRGGYFIARATAIWFGLCASAFLPTFVGGLFFRRMTRPAAIASMTVGLIVTAVWLLLIKDAEAGAIGLVRLLTPALPDGTHPNSILFRHPNWPSVDPLLIALPLSTLTAIVVSFFTKPPAAEHLDRCFATAKASTGIEVALSR